MAHPGEIPPAVDGEQTLSGLIGQTINRRAGIRMVLVPHAAAEGKGKSPGRQAGRRAAGPEPDV
jgi:hypothetical protein